MAAIIVFFIGRYLYSNIRIIEKIGSGINYAYISFASLMMFINLWLVASAWHLTVTRFTGDVSWRDNINIYFSTQLVKYVPGSVWLFFGKIYLYERRNIAKKTIISAMLVESAASISAGLIVFLLAIPFIGSVHEGFYYMLALIPVLLIFINPTVLTAFLNFLLRISRHEEMEIKSGYGQMLSLAAFYSLIWIWTGLTMYVFASAFTPIGINKVPELIGITALASVLGLISFLTPAGIGVREATFSLLLGLFIPLPVAVLVAVAARLWETLIELFAIGSARLLTIGEVR